MANVVTTIEDDDVANRSSDEKKNEPEDYTTDTLIAGADSSEDDRMTLGNMRTNVGSAGGGGPHCINARRRSMSVASDRPSVETIVVKAKRAASNLWVLLHAQSCNVTVDKCRHGGCQEAKLLLLHLKTCAAGDGFGCPSKRSGCDQARKLLGHYRRCRTIRARQASQHQPRGNPQQQQHVCLICSMVARQARAQLERGGTAAAAGTVVSSPRSLLRGTVSIGSASSVRKTPTTPKVASFLVRKDEVNAADPGIVEREMPPPPPRLVQNNIVARATASASSGSASRAPLGHLVLERPSLPERPMELSFRLQHHNLARPAIIPIGETPKPFNSSVCSPVAAAMPGPAVVGLPPLSENPAGEQVEEDFEIDRRKTCDGDAVGQRGRRQRQLRERSSSCSLSRSDAQERPDSDESSPRRPRSSTWCGPPSSTLPASAGTRTDAVARSLNVDSKTTARVGHDMTAVCDTITEEEGSHEERESDGERESCDMDLS